MKIILVSPAAVQSSNGNFTTASRWQKILRTLGHHVSLTQKYNGCDCDLLIALHAWRSADSIRLFKSQYPNKPLIVALTGTDAYQFIHSHSNETLRSIELADQLIGLHKLITHSIPAQHQEKVNIIYQASTLKPIRTKRIKNNFNVCVAGHLREVKDPLRTAYAARSLPSKSKIYITHFGKAHNLQWDNIARVEAAKNRRYNWHGEISQSLLRVKLSDAKLMVLSSLMEGGANIISEAIMMNLPIIASKIDGSIGLLGEGYAGYFDVENTQQLRSLLLRCERDNNFYYKLKHQCHSRKKLFSHQQELNTWKQLISKFYN